jgi:Ni,Fe-hydrogenase III small subunit/Pyruvate/2-oxoacid:ferredoxin oxidoreductase delta subunit
MFQALYERLRQKKRTVLFPKAEPTLPDRFRGRPKLSPERCGPTCANCKAVCPTGALQATPQGPRIDMGLCLFCGACAEACPSGAVSFTQDYRLAARKREDLLVGSDQTQRLADALAGRAQKLFGRSLKLRQVSAAGCNACEADLNVLTTIVFDLQRFGIDFVASPRHADGICVTGPVSENMREGLLKTYAAIPEPKLVIAVGACAISGGPFVDFPAQHNGVAGLLPVDLFVPGCPPHPIVTLDGLLRLLGRR